MPKGPCLTVSTAHRLELYIVHIRHRESEPEMKRPDDKGYIGLQPLKRARVQGPLRRCDVCTRLFSHQGLQDLNSSPGFAHKPLQDLISSARAGCDLCGFIYELVPKEFGYSLEKGECLCFWNLTSNTIDEKSHINALAGRMNGAIGGITLYPFVEES